jgi:hypothetical protein
VIKGAYKLRCSQTEGFGGGVKNAMEKSLVDNSEEGVTIIVGKASFSVFRGRERSSGH